MLKHGIMRIAVFAAGAAMMLASLPVPCLAEEWSSFGIRRAGFIFDLPPGFSLDHVAGDGQSATFRGPEQASIVVRGEYLSGGNFKKNVEALMLHDEGLGWNFTYRRLTNSWASYSGVKDGMIRYVRAIKTCNDRIAVFRMIYGMSEKLDYDPIVVRMVKSLKSEGC